MGLESVTDPIELKSTRDLIVDLEAAARGVLSTRAHRTFFCLNAIVEYFPPVALKPMLIWIVICVCILDVALDSSKRVRQIKNHVREWVLSIHSTKITTWALILWWVLAWETVVIVTQEGEESMVQGSSDYVLIIL